MTPLETKIRALIAALDDSALEALASKGLLRRAQKDLERNVSIVIEAEDAAAMHLKVEQFKVSMPEAGPARAKCSCPAAGVCQHILTAVLFLRHPAATSEENNAKPDANISVEQELLSFTREQLEVWAGKATFRAAAQLASQSSIEVKSERGLVIRFPAINSQCYCAPGAGLDGIIVSGNAKDERRIALAAVIAFQKLKGVVWEMPQGPTVTPEESEGAPRSRCEVLEVSQQIFDEMLENGLARVSSAMQQRLATLAVSAVGVNLPRLSLELRGLSDECSLIVSRDARSDLGRLLDRMAHAHALCTAIQLGGADPRPDLVGWHRTHYDEIGHLDLTGVAAWPWRTASGYAGLTLLFWDAAGKCWNSWSESRPTHQQRFFDPVARYTQPGPWEGAESPRQLARSCFRLMQARRNPLNRLSGSSKSRALVTGPADLRGLPVIEDWRQLSQPSDAQVYVGLKEANRLNSIFAVKPSEWGQRGYDPIRQLFAWILMDSQQKPLVLELAFDKYSEPAIKYLEGVTKESLKDAIIVGRFQQTPRGRTFHPHTIHQRNGEVSHLFLDTIKPAVMPAVVSAPVEEDDGLEDEAEENDQVTTFSPAMSGLFSELEEALLAIAETGIAGLNPIRIERIRQLEPRAEQFGLQNLAAAMTNIVNRRQADTVLRCVYVNRLHRLAEPLAAVTA